MGMCFGVQRAILRAHAAAERGPLTILGDMVHNEIVLADLRARGIRTCTDAEAVDTGTVMITAHGTSETRMTQLRGRGLRVLNATCPLVRAAHQALAVLVAGGCHPVIVGQEGHVEVRGLTEDLAGYDVVLGDRDVDRLQERPRFGIMAQTTQPVERLYRIAALVRRRFPQSGVEAMNTVCLPTRLRQESAEELARANDVVLVIGGTHSNNTRELAATCRRHCARVHHVQSAAELRAEWFTDAGAIGVTAGTSTPDATIEEVEAALRALAKNEAAA
jgi:4-hydroxy-3-methylbut-2-enyl diphosphate reductase